MIHPRDLRPGDRVYVYGFMGTKPTKSKGGAPTRAATYIRHLRCGYELRFDAGYTEHWREVSLLYALNGIDIPSTYAPGDTTPEKHVMELLTGSRQHGD